MNKQIFFFVCLLHLALFSDDIDFIRLNSAYANGVIVTVPENTPPKKSAPQKKPPVKKEAKPTPPPVQEIKEEVVLPTPLEEALILMEQRFFARATSLLEQIVMQEPRNAHAWYALGRAYEARGFFPKAQRALRRTLEIDPAFNELSRYLEYPANGKRRPLWDPRRPARIEEIPVAIDGFTIVPPSETIQPSESSSQHTVQYIPPAPVAHGQPQPQTPSFPMQPASQAHNSISPASGVPVRVIQPGAPSSQDPASLPWNPSPGVSDLHSPFETTVPAYIPPGPPAPDVPALPGEGTPPAYTPPPPGMELPQ